MRAGSRRNLRDDADRAERRDERERERDAAEVRGDARERRETRRGPSAASRRGSRRTRSRGRAARRATRRDEADLDARLVRVAGTAGRSSSRTLSSVAAAVDALERADHDLAGGQEQEQQRVGEERHRRRATRATGASGRTLTSGRSASGAASRRDGYDPTLRGPLAPRSAPSPPSAAPARELHLGVDRRRRQRREQRLRDHLPPRQVRNRAGCE